jgi:hypothetical protein
MTFKFVKELSLPKLIGRFGILAVDTFSTLIFFMLQGDSWVLTTAGFIFAFTKVWHWQQSFKAVDKLRRFLHRGAWLLMAILSIYFLITLGLSITQTPPEEVVDQNIAALEEAIAKSRVANVEALTKEQDSLLRQNEGLTERLLTLNQWSQAWGPIQAQLDANLARLGIIAAELNKVYAEQSVATEVEDIQKEKEETMILRFKPVKPIGAHSLMARVMPDNWIDASIVILFFLIGIVMEITLALSSLPEEKWLRYQPEKDPENKKNDDWVPPPARDESKPPVADEPPPAETPAEEVPEIPQEESPPPKTEDAPVHERKGYAAEEIIAYIDAAYDNNKLKPDNTVEGIPEADCAGIRGYLQSFKLRGKIIVEQVDGVFQVRLDKESLKKFVALQCSIQRVQPA